ncbi:MAG: CHAD domain-containing protein [Phycisphaeraceae bacterium]|nr:MAG: CHAD domain-containing protein [Phycisphaeraceae bacterium]
MTTKPGHPAVQIGAAFPAEIAAAAIINSHGTSVIGAAREAKADRLGRRSTHELRTACRRMDEAASVFLPCLNDRVLPRLAREVVAIRKAAGKVRDWDIFLDAVNASARQGGVLKRKERRALVDAVKHIRLRKVENAAKSIGKARLAGIESLIGRLERDAFQPDGESRLYSDVAVNAITRRSEDAKEHLASVTGASVESIHSLRIAARGLRHVLEITRACTPAHLYERAASGLDDELESLGHLADLSSARATLAASRHRLERSCAEGVEALDAWLVASEQSSLESALARIESGNLARLVSELQSWADEARGTPLFANADPAANAVALVPTRADRYAVIDVGSNSVRLLVGELLTDGTYRVLDDEKESTRLGQGLMSTGMLSAQSMLRTAETIARMRGIAQGYGVSRLRVFGTSATRDATNQREFLALVRELAGVSLEVLSEEDEARAAHRSVAAGFDIGETPTAVVDIGGGSTEIVLSTKGAIEHLCSIRMGAVRLTEMFVPHDREKTVRRMRRYVRRALELALPEVPFAPNLVVGTGGTFTSLAAIASVRSESVAGAEGTELRRSEVRHLLDRLGDMSLRDRMRVPRLNPERADIIVAGAAIAEGVLRHLNANRLRVHDRGIRDGIMLEMISETERPSVPASGSRAMSAARRFAEGCRYEREHSEHVAMLSLRLFDHLLRADLLPRGVSTNECRTLLEAAAVLHDVGYLINYAGHHKHSMRLILNSAIPGFTKRQIGIIANIARYHRRAEPSGRHGSYKLLSRPDRRIVKALAAILRVADGLDRAHTQLISDISLRTRSGADGSREATLVAIASERPTTDLWGAERKAALFERVYRARLRCLWEPVESQPKSTVEQPTAKDRSRQVALRIV